MQMVSEVRMERRQTQQLLNACLQSKLKQQSKLKCPNNRRTGTTDCNQSEVRRLKEEARALRARMRRMVVPTTEITSSAVVSPTKSSLTSSLETIGNTLVRSMVDTTAERMSTYSSRRVNNRSINSNTTSTSARRVPTKSTTTKGSAVSNPRSNRSRLNGTSSRNRGNSNGATTGIVNRPKNLRKPQKKPRKLRRSRRASLKETASELEPLLKRLQKMDLDGQHFQGPFYQSGAHVGEGVHFHNPRVRKTNQTHQDDHYWSQSRGRRSVRRKRDVTESHFIGANNNAHAFNASNFYGSTENRTDNSHNVRNFNPRVSPKIDLSAHGANETIIHKSNNGNDIKITTAHPCVCEPGDSFDFKTLLWSIWLQICISLLLALGVTVHYHLRSHSARRKQKDLLKMERLRLDNQSMRRSNRAEEIRVVSNGGDDSGAVGKEIVADSACAIIV